MEATEIVHQYKLTCICGGRAKGKPFLVHARMGRTEEEMRVKIKNPEPQPGDMVYCERCIPTRHRSIPYSEKMAFLNTVNTVTDDAHILELLRQKHSGDVFIEECKTGSTHFDFENPVQRMDVWVMRKTWSPITTICYEIKTSRSDFLRDKKWSGYLDYCHQFYFVTPPKLIKKEELPPEVGLIEVTKTGSKLRTVKRVYNRKPTLFYMPMVYTLMWRTNVSR